ncbi:MAG: hypothetical protein ACRDPG_09480 [Nocardioidaceae bacterium]
MSRPTRRRARIARAARTQSGSALVELTWLGVLLVIPLVYLVITLVTVQAAAYGATEAARAAGRAYVLAPDLQSARHRAYAAGWIAMHDQGVDLQPADLVARCLPTPRSCLQPGSSVEVRIALHVALPLMPPVFGRSAASIAVDAVHIERYGVYREAGGR